MRHISLVRVVAIVALAGCGDPSSHQDAPLASQPATAATPSQPLSAATTTGARSGTVHDSVPVDTLPMLVERPTVVAFSTLTQADVDSEPDMAEALSDFQFSLASARDSLAKLGVDFGVHDGDTIAWSEGAMTKRWIASADSTAMGYLLLAPGATPRVKYGVETDGGLVDWVTSQLHAAGRRDTASPARPAP